MKPELLVRGGEVVLPSHGLCTVDIAIHNGKIAAVVEPGTFTDAERAIDATGRLVLPGVIDAHTHLTMGPGEAGYETETQSAAIGGVTSSLSYIMDSGDLAATVQREITAGESRACGDFGLHPCLVTERQLEDFAKVFGSLAIPSFKFFTTFRGAEAARLNLPPNDDGFMFKLLRIAAQLPGTLVCVHAENIEVSWALQPETQERGDGGLEDWARARPDIAEGEAVRRVLYYAEKLDVPIYIVHITSGEALDAVRAAKTRRPGRVFGETCVSYLSLTCETAPCPAGKVNPPLRHAADVDALWEGVADDTIDVVASDHVPRRFEAKDGGIWKASPGFPGVATLLPVLLTEGRRRKLPLETLVTKVTSAPAAIFGLLAGKGSLLPGAQGDLTIVDPEREHGVVASMLHSYADYTPYEGRRLRYMPTHTVLRGRVVVENGRYVGKRGDGVYLRRRLS
jgi:dihydropyrimidinase